MPHVLEDVNLLRAFGGSFWTDCHRIKEEICIFKFKYCNLIVKLNLVNYS